MTQPSQKFRGKMKRRILLLVPSPAIIPFIFLEIILLDKSIGILRESELIPNSTVLHITFLAIIVFIFGIIAWSGKRRFVRHIEEISENAMTLAYGYIPACAAEEIIL